MRDFAKSFYKSKRWQKCRDAFMESKHYICERCGRPAVIAHHRKYITPENINDPNIALSWDNLECLCNACHEAEHRGKLPVISEGLKFDKRGNVVKKTMSLSRLSKQCRECRYVKACQHKRMEAVMAQASAPLTEPAAMPALAKHDYRDVKIAENTTVTIDLEELKENMRKSFYKGALDVFRSAT